MTQRKKNNIIIGSLCAVVLLMAVGYAAFQSILNIKGTSTIGSNWNILITNVQSKNIVGSASNKEDPSWEDLTATFKTNLVSPGDSIEYDITIENRGNLNAKLDKITLSDSNNEVIKFTSSGLEEGTELNAGGTATLTVKVEYDNNVTSQPENTEGTFTVTLDYSQKEGSSEVPNPITPSDLISGAVTSGDGLYADEYESGRYIYKGTNPNNYITFNNEPWRIISVEADHTIKIVKKDSIGNMAFDSKGYRDSTSNGAGGTYCVQGSNGCNAWAVSNNFVNGTKSGTVLKSAELNTYLNGSYYNNLNNETQKLIKEYQFSVGPVTYNNTDLAGQIQSENRIKWNGKIGLMTASEFLRSNTNTDQCGNYSLNNTNRATCKTTNYIVPTSVNLWMISPCESNVSIVLNVSTHGNVNDSYADYAYNGVLPVLYLTSNITLSGEGTSSSPYTIIAK